MRLQLASVAALLILLAPGPCVPQHLGGSRAAGGEAGSVRIRLDHETGGSGTFRVAGWPARGTPELQEATLDQWRALFSVYVDGGSFSRGSERPPILGSYEIEDGTLIFRPRFPLQPGLRYRAVFRPPPAAGAGSGPETADAKGKTSATTLPNEPIVATFEIPEVNPARSTVVRHVYPSSSRLPENQLKFYIHFSAPMARGEAYRRLHLLNEAGAEIDLPFLELHEELWDREGQRLTIFFDPGRVKRGLIPHDEAGPPIEAGKKYTLVIDRDWRDATGRPLKEGFRKSFTVGPPDRDPPTLATWRLTEPKAGAVGPLTVEFPEPLDMALLLRLVEVTDTASQPVPGSVQVDREETRWRFTPQQPWEAGAYFLSVGTTLEDLAGNNIDRTFEVDVFERVEDRIHRETKRLRFEVR